MRGLYFAAIRKISWIPGARAGSIHAFQEHTAYNQAPGALKSCMENYLSVSPRDEQAAR